MELLGMMLFLIGTVITSIAVATTTFTVVAFRAGMLGILFGSIWQVIGAVLLYYFK